MRLLYFIGLFSALLMAFNCQAATILVHGDSLSAGYGIESGKEWVALLKQQLPKDNIINSSVSGETSLGGLKRLPALLKQYQPDVLILELGANDGLRGQPLDQMQNHLAAMIELAQQHKSQVLLLGVRIPPNYGKRYSSAFHQVYDDLAKRYALTYIAFFLDGIAGDSQLMQNDGLHPNESGQPLILKNIDKSLMQLLQGKH